MNVPYILPAGGALNSMFVLMAAVAVVLVGLGAEALAYRVWLRRGIAYRRSFSTHAAYTGEEIRLEETLINGKLLPVPWAMTEMSLPGALTETPDASPRRMPRLYRAITFLPSHKTINRRQKLWCRHRGYYQLGGSRLEIRDLFGFAKGSGLFFSKEELYVYPAILPEDRMPSSLLQFQGDVTARRWILPDPILVAGIREYQTGDSVRDIHWNATARTGEAQVKVRDFTVSPQLMVLVNVASRDGLWAAMEPEQQELAEPALEVAATLCDWAVRHGLEIGFAANTAPEPRMRTPFLCFLPAAGAAHHEELLRAMARMEIQCRVNFTTVLDQLIEEGITGMDLAILTRYRSDDLLQRTRELQAMGNSVSFLETEKEGAEDDQRSAV